MKCAPKIVSDVGPTVFAVIVVFTCVVILPKCAFEFIIRELNIVLPFFKFVQQLPY